MFATICDNIIAACQEFYVRDNGVEIPMHEHPELNTGGMPVRYDMSLVRALALDVPVDPPPTARTVLMTLFGHNDLAIETHGNLLSRWMMKLDLDIDMDLGK
jgi:hypothetical protein